MILGICPTQGFADTALTAEPQYSIKFSKSNKKFCLSLHYNGRNSFLFVNATKMFQFKANDSEIKKNPLCSWNILKDSTNSNMKKTGLNGYVYEFSVGYNIIDTSNIVDVHKYSMKKHNIE